MSEVIDLNSETIASGLPTPIEMLDRALSSNADADTLEKLMALQERWEANNARKAFDAAMSALRGDLPEIVKSSKVDYNSTKYKYEDLSAVTSTLSPVMANHGLSFRWRTKQENGTVTVTCIVAHRDGHFEETSLTAAPDTGAGKNAIQALGSSVTYLQRYTLKAAVGVAATHEDDGRGAIDQTDPEPKQSAPAYDETKWIDKIDKARGEKAVAAVKAELQAEADNMPPPSFKTIKAHFVAHIKREKELANATG